MGTWFNIATTRGDLIARIPEEDVLTAKDFMQWIEDKKSVIVEYAMSPKAIPSIKGVCGSCSHQHEISIEEANVMVADKGGVCPECGEKAVVPMQDESNVRIEYRNLGSLFNTTELVIGTAQITYVALVNNQDEMEIVRDSVYPEIDDEPSENIIQLH